MPDAEGVSGAGDHRGPMDTGVEGAREPFVPLDRDGLVVRTVEQERRNAQAAAGRDDVETVAMGLDVVQEIEAEREFLPRPRVPDDEAPVLPPDLLRRVVET